MCCGRWLLVPNCHKITSTSSVDVKVNQSWLALGTLGDLMDFFCWTYLGRLSWNMDLFWTYSVPFLFWVGGRCWVLPRFLLRCRLQGLWFRKVFDFFRHFPLLYPSYEILGQQELYNPSSDIRKEVLSATLSLSWIVKKC